MADKLEIYRGALQLLGNSAGLSSLTEVAPARHRLDEIWSPSVDYLLTKGLWNFAMRTIELSYDEDVEAGFGRTYAFSKPTDWIRTASICDTGDFDGSFEDFDDENGYWAADVTKLYIKYVSSDTDYGWNVGSWRQPFAQALEAYLAFKSGLPISDDRGNRNDMHALFGKMLKEAKAIDAVDEAVKRRPAGRLVTSRLTRRNSKDG